MRWPSHVCSLVILLALLFAMVERVMIKSQLKVHDCAADMMRMATVVVLQVASMQEVWLASRWLFGYLPLQCTT